MARIGISCEKNTLFRGFQQPFWNTYYYERVLGLQTGEAVAIRDEIVNAEKSLHANNVNFVRLRIWTADGNAGENEMLHDFSLSGVGVLTPNINMDKERAFLIRWAAGKDSRNHNVYLRKWYHTCGNPAAGIIPTNVMANEATLSTALRNEMATKAQDLKVVGGTVDTWSLCSKVGRNVEGDAECHRYLEHHQLGDQWR